MLPLSSSPFQTSNLFLPAGSEFFWGGLALWIPLLRFQPQAAEGQREGVGFAQHNAISEQFEKDVVVAEQNKAHRQGVVPALRPQQRV